MIDANATREQVEAFTANAIRAREETEAFISNAVSDCLTKPKRAVSPVEGQLLLEGFEWSSLRGAAEMRDNGQIEGLRQLWVDGKLRISARMVGAINKITIRGEFL